MQKVRIIGISAYFHDSAAALIENGKIIYASQEERFTRIKHDSNFPKNALKNLLEFNNITLSDVDYVVFTNKVSNSTYKYGKDDINILMKDGEIKNITDASDQFNIQALSKTINKYFLCYP